MEIRAAQPLKRIIRRKLRPLGIETLEPRAMFSVAQLRENIVSEIMEQAPEAVAAAPAMVGLLRTNGTFSDLKYTPNTDAGASHIREHARRIEQLTVALRWENPGNVYFGDAGLKGKIVAAWNYAANSLKPISAPNWWWKQIGIPAAFAEPLLLISNDLSPAARTSILSKFFSAAWDPVKHVAGNLTSQATGALIQGVLQNNSQRIADVVQKVSAEITGFSGEGMARDLSFMQHQSQGKMNFSSGSYGVGFAVDVSKLMRWTAGTAHAFQAPAVEQQVRFVLDHLQYLTRGDTMDLAASGRSITRPGSITTLPLGVREAAIDLEKMGVRRGEFEDLIDRFLNGVNDDNALVGNRALWRGDAMLHSRREISATVKLLSSRTLRPETAAGENRQGYFLGDGMTLFLQDGDELGAAGEQAIIPVWNWQRLPGTTVQQTGVIPYEDMFKGGKSISGSSNLVGGASDGQYGVAMMDYRRPSVSLTARKAWFFFDDEIIALGADIDDAQAKKPVFTTLNQVLLDGNVIVSGPNGPAEFGLGGTASLQGGSWIWHDRMGYVVLDESSTTTVQAKLQTGGGIALPVFSAWVDHGAKPQNATYAYAVTPGVTPEELAAYAEDLPVEILANTATVQAVRRNDLGLTQAAFYGTGEIWIDEQTRLAVSQPCVLMVRQVDGDWSITAADPRQGTKPIAIDVNRQLTGPGATWNEQTQTTRILFTVPTGANAGASATQTYSLTPSPTPLIGEGEFTEDFGSLAGAPNAFRAMTGPEGSSPENKTSPAVPLWAFQTAKGASGGAGPGAASNATDKESLASAADQYFAQLAGGRQVVNPLQFEENTISFLV